MANPFQSALRDTEREVFDYGVHVNSADEEFDAIADAEENDRIIEEQSQVESSDGDHLSDQEGLARAIQGDDADPNYIGDRPLQYQHELAVERRERTAAPGTRRRTQSNRPVAGTI